MPLPCSFARPWCSISDVPPSLCGTITAVHAGGGAWQPTDWMLQLVGFQITLNLMRYDPSTGCAVWFGCASIPPKVKKLGVRMYGGIHAVLRTCCPQGPADWKFRWYVFPSGHNPAPEIVDPPEPGDGKPAGRLDCGPPLFGQWGLQWADWTVTEGPCPPPLPPSRRDWFSGAWFSSPWFSSPWF